MGPSLVGCTILNQHASLYTPTDMLTVRTLYGYHVHVLVSNTKVTVTTGAGVLWLSRGMLLFGIRAYYEIMVVLASYSP